MKLFESVENSTVLESFKNLYLNGRTIFETTPLCTLMYIPEDKVLISSVTFRPCKSYIASSEMSLTLTASMPVMSEAVTFLPCPIGIHISTVCIHIFLFTII